MIVFQQIRNATVKLKYPGGTFMIDPWLMDACDPIERERAVAARRFIPKPICPLPAPAEALAGDVTLLLAVQEETTMLGGTTGAAGIDPDYALVTDVTFGETPDTKKGDAFPLGSGVVISLSAVTDRRLTARTVELAKDKGIGYHRSVEPTGTGTDANATQLTNCGIPTVVVSLPLRYMHTYHELISNDDAEALRSLIAAFLADRSIAEEFGR